MWETQEIIMPIGGFRILKTGCGLKAKKESVKM
jgi:hypothetical protein